MCKSTLALYQSIMPQSTAQLHSQRSTGILSSSPPLLSRLSGKIRTNSTAWHIQTQLEAFQGLYLITVQRLIKEKEGLVIFTTVLQMLIW